MITDYDYDSPTSTMSTDYDYGYDNEFAFAPKKFFTPPVLQRQSTFLDIFSDIDLQIGSSLHICTTPTRRMTFYARWLD